MDLKTQAILTVAKAYIARGKKLQYDQRCMDRKLFLTPRRTKCMPPESATEQHTLYLDCSSYMGAIFYETFGQELPFDLTWHMVDYLKPRLFYYERTYQETPEEVAELIQTMRTILKPGDVITFDRTSGSGHTLLYMGGDDYTHCTPHGRPDSYDYENRQSREYEDGGLFIDSLTELMEEKLFGSATIKRIAIERPLDVMGEPTKNTLARMGDAKDLICGVEASCCGGRHAIKGESVTYTVWIENQGEERNVVAEFKTSKDALSTQKVHLSDGERAEVKFETVVETEDGCYIETPMLTVNGLTVWVPRVLSGKAMEEEQVSRLNQRIEQEILDGKTAIEAASKAYGDIGIKMPEKEEEYIYRCFFLHDSTSGDVLSRRAQKPDQDLAVYSLFGGTGVTTPEMISDPYIRCNQIRRCDLMAGDLILCSDTPYSDQVYSCYYTGEKLVGRFAYGNKVEVLKADDIDKMIDSLFGHFCFVVIRPCLGK